MGKCVSSLIDRQLIETVLWAIGIGAPLLHLGAELVVILTHTPRPGSRWAKVYRLIEVLAGQVGWAKDTGLLPPSPGRFDSVVQQAEKQLAQLQGNSR